MSRTSELDSFLTGVLDAEVRIALEGAADKVVVMLALLNVAEISGLHEWH